MTVAALAAWMGLVAWAALAAPVIWVVQVTIMQNSLIAKTDAAILHSLTAQAPVMWYARASTAPMVLVPVVVTCKASTTVQAIAQAIPSPSAVVPAKQTSKAIWLEDLALAVQVVMAIPMIATSQMVLLLEMVLLQSLVQQCLVLECKLY